MILPKNTPYEEFIETNIKIYTREYGLNQEDARECAQIEWDIREEVRHTNLKSTQKAFLNPTPGFGTRPIHIAKLVENAPVPTDEDHKRNALKKAREELSHRARIKKQVQIDESRALAKAQSDAVERQSEKNSDVGHTDISGESEHKDAASPRRLGIINRVLFEKFKSRRVLKVSEVNLLLGFSADDRKPDDFPRAFRYAKELVYTTYKVYDWIRANKDKLNCIHRINLN